MKDGHSGMIVEEGIGSGKRNISTDDSLNDGNISMVIFFKKKIYKLV